ESNLVLCGASFLFSSRRRHTRVSRDWSSDVCSSDLSSIQLRRRTSALYCPIQNSATTTAAPTTTQTATRIPPFEKDPLSSHRNVYFDKLRKIPARVVFQPFEDVPVHFLLVQLVEQNKEEVYGDILK